MLIKLWIHQMKNALFCNKTITFDRVNFQECMIGNDVNNSFCFFFFFFFFFLVEILSSGIVFDFSHLQGNKFKTLLWKCHLHIFVSTLRHDLVFIFYFSIWSLVFCWQRELLISLALLSNIDSTNWTWFKGLD